LQDAAVGVIIIIVISIFQTKKSLESFPIEDGPTD
jgi:hypothetical protein